MSARLKRDFSQTVCDEEDPDALDVSFDGNDGFNVDVGRRTIAIPRGVLARGDARWGEQRSSGDFGEAPFLSMGNDGDVDMH
jgi:hypothetical protein